MLLIVLLVLTFLNLMNENKKNTFALYINHSKLSVNDCALKHNIRFKSILDFEIELSHINAATLSSLTHFQRNTELKKNADYCNCYEFFSNGNLNTNYHMKFDDDGNDTVSDS